VADRPDESEPPDHVIKARDWKTLPGGHAVYYQAAENYGALGIIALDPQLNWSGIGPARVSAAKAGGNASIALTFPEWRGNNTVLEARKENRLLRQPLLVSLVGPASAGGGRQPAGTPEVLPLSLTGAAPRWRFSSAPQTKRTN
jgi:hypothetical protein